MQQKFERIIKYLTETTGSCEPLSKIDIHAQFHPGEEKSYSIARNLNAAFWIALSGKSDPLYDQAVEYLDDFQDHPSWKKIVLFYKDGLGLIRSEISDRCSTDDKFEKDLTRLYSWITSPETTKNSRETLKKIRHIFFPEGSSLSDPKKRKEKIDLLRKKRKIRISKLNPLPITDPAREILFTSNILVTIPPASKNINDLPISNYLKQSMGPIVQEDQEFWYDHPIPIGVTPEHNEALYGLEGLDRAVQFEKDRGTLGKNNRLSCILSVSVTHEGLQGIIKEYLEDEFKKEKNIQHLDVYVFTEADTMKLIDEILIPAAEKYMALKEHSALYKIIGVDGEYGRHYSFLKAISAFWQVLVSPDIRGTFKIDLDQVFPQDELVEQTGLSAFEHLKTPLWGAEGLDSEGNAVELGMIAGALVNKTDISRSLFYPDVCFPDNKVRADDVIFLSSLPQALSTEAEMMTRYNDNTLNGKEHCIQRIHVTGGTCGILVEPLRRYQPFTPTFIGRAEDQAYILSMLADPSKNLRYVHKDGLIMRHDKQAFAGEAIKIAATGKIIGDYIRILMFSYYVSSLASSPETVKRTIDPFTGCFVSKIPLTVVYLRFALKTASFFSGDTKDSIQQGFEFLQIGRKRLHDTIKYLSANPNPLIEQFQKEKNAWALFYDILNTIEERLKKGDTFAVDLQRKAGSLVKECRINF